MSETLNISPEYVHFTIWKGDTLSKTITLTDGNNVAINLTTAIVKMQIRKEAGGTIYTTITNGDGLSISGLNSIVISKLIDIPAGTYKYDLEVTYLSGVVRTYLAGQFRVQDDITRNV